MNPCDIKSITGLCCFFTSHGFLLSGSGSLRGNLGNLFDTFNKHIKTDCLICYTRIEEQLVFFLKHPYRDYRGRGGFLGCAVSFKSKTISHKIFNYIILYLMKSKDKLFSCIKDKNIDYNSAIISKLAHNIFDEDLKKLNENFHPIKYNGNYQSNADLENFNKFSSSKEMWNNFSKKRDDFAFTVSRELLEKVILDEYWISNDKSNFNSEIKNNISYDPIKELYNVKQEFNNEIELMTKKYNDKIIKLENSILMRVNR